MAFVVSITSYDDTSVTVNVSDQSDPSIHPTNSRISIKEGSTWSDSFAGSSDLDANGDATITGLVPGKLYSAWLNSGTGGATFTTTSRGYKIPTAAQWQDLATRIKNAGGGGATLFYISDQSSWATSSQIPLYAEKTLTNPIAKPQFMDAAKQGPITLVVVATQDAPTDYYNWDYYAVVFNEDDSMSETLGSLHFAVMGYSGLIQFTWDQTTNPVVTDSFSFPNIVQTTGTSTTSVMSQKATTDMVYQDGNSRSKIRIGYNAVANGSNSVSVGPNSIAQGTGGVAIGAFSRSVNTGTMDIGSTNTSYGYASSNYRLLTGLYDPQNAHDAATKGYVDSVAGGGLITLSYGSSTWQDFLDAYNAGEIVYCRASSGSNPGVGDQTRMAFMAYVNNPTTPTEVEFQYVRSVSTKSAAQPCDQVFVYTLTPTNGGTWTVESRNVTYKVAAGTNVTTSYSNGTVTINADAPVITMTSTDPGEGGSLAANNFIAVYNAS